MDEWRRLLLALSMVPGVGSRRLHALLRAFDGQPERVFASSRAGLLQVEGVGPKLADLLLQGRGMWLQKADMELSWLRRNGGWILTFGDEDYPRGLASMEDVPPLLFGLGSLPEGRSLAVVGSRACTDYGLRMTDRLCAPLARAGVCLVSGLARGIDGRAHECALAAGAPTLAFVGSGLGKLYPPEHRGLAMRMVQAGGAVVSEHAHGVAAQAGFFPRRNRLIAGFADGCLVVESGLKGGSMITARLAAELGKQVYALPGAVDRPASQGCHALIRDGAQLVCSAQQIAQDLAWEGFGAGLDGDGGQGDGAAAGGRGELALGKELAALLELLRREGELGVDGLVAAGLGSAAELSRMLLQLELLGRVRALPGGRYALV